MNLFTHFIARFKGWMTGHMGSVMLSSREGRFTSIAYTDLANEAYIRNPQGYSAVRYLARACAQVPPIVYRVKKGGKGTKARLEALHKSDVPSAAKARRIKAMKAAGEIEEVESGALVDLLHRPNTALAKSWSQFVEHAVSYLQIGGKAFIYAPPLTTGDRKGQPAALWFLQPDRVDVVEGKTMATPIEGYRYQHDGGLEDYAPADVLFLRHFHPLDPIGGLSPFAPLARSIDQANEASKWNVRALQNDMRPPGAFVSSTPLTDEQFKRLDALINDRYAGAQNARKPFVMGAGMSWQAMAQTAAETDWRGGRRDAAREIAMGQGVAPELLGDGEAKTFANYAEGRTALYQDHVVPLMTYLAEELTAFLCTRERGTDEYWIGINTDDVEALQESRDAVWTRMNTAWYLSINERRAALGYEGIGADGDVRLVPYNFVPLEIMADGGTVLVAQEREPAAPAEGGEKGDALFGSVGRLDAAEFERLLEAARGQA